MVAQIVRIIIFLWNFFSLTEISAIIPDEEILQQEKNSGLKIVDWSQVSRVILNQRVITNDPKNICCTSNFSVAWDLDDEIIAFVVDNFFCPDTLQNMTTDVLHKHQKWETSGQAVNRAHRFGAHKSEDYYQGNYPGVTSMKVISDKDYMLMLRRCFQPYLKILLDSEQVHVLSQVLESHFLETPMHTEDILDPVEIFEVDHACEGHECSFRGDNDNDEGDDETKLKILNNPILPKYWQSFFASASLPAKNITFWHTAPHVDGTPPGYASVYTLSKNKSYEKTATTFNRMSQSNLSIITSNDQRKSINQEISTIQMIAIESGKSRDSGWLNQSSNRFSDVIAMAYNAYNRFTMYPSNRLHTAYISDENLLNANPSIGRLTMNTFWHVYESDPHFCKIVQKAQAQSLGLKTIPRQPGHIVKLCSACNNWPNHCVWCASTQECITKGNMCPKNEEHISTGKQMTCKEIAAITASCLAHKSCKTCSASGCTWCPSAGVCKNTVGGDGPCTNSKNSQVLPFHPEKCKRGYKNVNCKYHTLCHTCRDAGCEWCKDSKQCLPDTQPTSCPVNQRVGGAIIEGGTFTCPKVESEMKQRMLTTNEDCKINEKCSTCMDTIGCVWCLDKIGGLSGKCQLRVLEEATPLPLIQRHEKRCKHPVHRLGSEELFSNERNAGYMSPQMGCPLKDEIFPLEPSFTNHTNGGIKHSIDIKEKSVEVPGRFNNIGNVTKIESLPHFQNLLLFHQDVTGLPLVLIFIADNCVECIAFSSTYNKAAKFFKNQIAFFDVNVDNNLELMKKYEIPTVPHLLIFEEGQLVSSIGDVIQTFDSVVSDLDARVKSKALLCVNKLITEKSLVQFYEKFDKEMVIDAKNVLAKFGNKHAKLLRILFKTYGHKPELTEAYPNGKNQKNRGIYRN